MQGQNPNINNIQPGEQISGEKLRPSKKADIKSGKFNQILKEVSNLDNKIDKHIKNMDKIDPSSPKTINEALKSADDAFKTTQEYKDKMQNLIRLNRLKLQ